MEQFDSNLSSVIYSTLGMICRLYGYQYSEIIRSLMSAYFYGGSCIVSILKYVKFGMLTADLRIIKTDFARTYTAIFVRFHSSNSQLASNLFPSRLTDEIFICSYQISRFHTTCRFIEEAILLIVSRQLKDSIVESLSPSSLANTRKLFSLVVGFPISVLHPRTFDTPYP